MSLRERIEAELDQRETVARKLVLAGNVDPHGSAIRWGWANLSGRLWVRDADGDNVAEAATPLDADHIALHDPADALRRYAHARKVLKRHAPVERRDYGNDNWLACPRCGQDVTYKPCDPMRDLAESLGLEDR